MKVLIIDDEEAIVSMFTDTLEMNGHNVMVANCGQEGMARAKDFQPDIIVLDVNMPGIDGFTVLENLKKNEKTNKIPVLMATINDKGSDIEKGILLGAEKYMVKPFSIDSLEEAINKYGNGN